MRCNKVFSQFYLVILRYKSIFPLGLEFCTFHNFYLSRKFIRLSSRIMADSAMNGGLFSHNNTIAPKEEKVLPLFSNKGKTAIVSGAGAGIGLAVAQALAESGANVAIWYHSNKKALQRAEEIEKEYDVKCEPLYLHLKSRFSCTAKILLN